MIEWESCNNHITYFCVSTRTHSFCSWTFVLSIRPRMSAYPYPNDTRHQSYLQSDFDEDVKIPDDDLVDPHATPFSPISRHQTYVLGTPLKQQPSSLERSPSLPLSSVGYTSKQSNETYDTSYNYPPTPSQKGVDTPSLWERVCLHCRHWFLTEFRSV